MNENPDNADYIDFGLQCKQLNDEGVELSLDQRYLIPAPNMLRFVEKQMDNHGTPMKARVLQQYQWSHRKGGYDWYDLPLVTTTECEDITT